MGGDRQGHPPHPANFPTATKKGLVAEKPTPSNPGGSLPPALSRNESKNLNHGKHGNSRNKESQERKYFKFQASFQQALRRLLPLAFRGLLCLPWLKSPLSTSSFIFRAHDSERIHDKIVGHVHRAKSASCSSRARERSQAAASRAAAWLAWSRILTRGRPALHRPPTGQVPARSNRGRTKGR